MSSNTTTFSIRMDKDIKEQLDSFCSMVGMNTNTAINMFARVVVRQKRLPFDVTLENKPLTGEPYMTEPRRRAAAIDAGLVTQHELIEDSESD